MVMVSLKRVIAKMKHKSQMAILLTAFFSNGELSLLSALNSSKCLDRLFLVYQCGFQVELRRWRSSSFLPSRSPFRGKPSKATTTATELLMPKRSTTSKEPIKWRGPHISLEISYVCMQHGFISLSFSVAKHNVLFVAFWLLQTFLGKRSFKIELLRC